MRFDVLTLFPELVSAVTEYGVVRRASDNNLVTLNCINPRNYTKDVYRTVDDRPYGGGPGMIMKADCLFSALDVAKRENNGQVIYLSPQGKTLNQNYLQKLSQQSSIILLCGRYEGIDERVIQSAVDEECSIGDYVISGGELAAMVLIDALTRLLPGALGHELSSSQDSHVDGLLDCPHYTRPYEINGLKVPEILTQGDHGAIARWRRKQSLGMTWRKRPELLQQRNIEPCDQALLDEYKQENSI